MRNDPLRIRASFKPALNGPVFCLKTHLNQTAPPRAAGEERLAQGTGALAVLEDLSKLDYNQRKWIVRSLKDQLFLEKFCKTRNFPAGIRSYKAKDTFREVPL